MQQSLMLVFLAVLNLRVIIGSLIRASSLLGASSS
jgi:hypothetical protein